jgi:hypothetical protein
MLVGISFGCKFFLAAIKGRMRYWSGFMPLTVASPFLLHTPMMSKRSLIKETEGLWVHLLMAPVFLILATLCLGAGADLAGLPGTATVNYLLSAGKGGQDIVFDPHQGYKFPILAKAGPVLSRVFGGKMTVEEKDSLYVDNPGTLKDAVDQHN